MSIPRIVLSPASEWSIAIRSVIARAALVFTLCVGAAVTAEAASKNDTSGRATSTTSSATANLILLDVEGTDLTWNPKKRKLYVAVPSTAKAHGNTITMVDPIAGTVGGNSNSVRRHPD